MNSILILPHEAPAPERFHDHHQQLIGAFFERQIDHIEQTDNAEERRVPLPISASAGEDQTAVAEYIDIIAVSESQFQGTLSIGIYDLPGEDDITMFQSSGLPEQLRQLFESDR